MNASKLKIGAMFFQNDGDRGALTIKLSNDYYMHYVMDLTLGELKEELMKWGEKYQINSFYFVPTADANDSMGD